VKPRISITKLKKKADAVYSTKLRQSAADKNGMVKCYTCNSVKPWKEMQCGHFVTRTVTALRYHPKNTRVQCVGCNMFNQGRPDVFAYNLTKEYGVEVLQELQEIKNKTKLSPSQTRLMLEDVIGLTDRV